MVFKNPLGLLFASLGKKARKNTFNSRFNITLPILITAYFNGFFSALNFENGIMASASSVKIQMVYITYSTLMPDQFESVFRNNNEATKNPMDDQKIVTVEVDITLFLFSSVL